MAVVEVKVEGRSDLESTSIALWPGRGVVDRVSLLSCDIVTRREVTAKE